MTRLGAPEVDVDELDDEGMMECIHNFLGGQQGSEAILNGFVFSSSQPSQAASRPSFQPAGPSFQADNTPGAPFGPSIYYHPFDLQQHRGFDDDRGNIQHGRSFSDSQAWSLTAAGLVSERSQNPPDSNLVIDADTPGDSFYVSSPSQFPREYPIQQRQEQHQRQYQQQHQPLEAQASPALRRAGSFSVDNPSRSSSFDSLNYQLQSQHIDDPQPMHRPQDDAYRLFGFARGTEMPDDVFTSLSGSKHDEGDVAHFGSFSSYEVCSDGGVDMQPESSVQYEKAPARPRSAMSGGSALRTTVPLPVRSLARQRLVRNDALSRSAPDLFSADAEALLPLRTSGDPPDRKRRSVSRSQPQPLLVAGIQKGRKNENSRAEKSGTVRPNKASKVQKSPRTPAYLKVASPTPEVAARQPNYSGIKNCHLGDCCVLCKEGLSPRLRQVCNGRWRAIVGVMLRLLYDSLARANPNDCKHTDGGEKFLSLENDIYPFFEDHWVALQPLHKNQHSDWKPPLQNTLSHNQPFFESGKGKIQQTGHWRLGSAGLTVLPVGSALDFS